MVFISFIRWVSFSMISFLLFCSCDFRKREQELQKREEAIGLKEQQLLIKEDSLQLKEDELLKRTHLLDSMQKMAAPDTSSINPDLAGIWAVKMDCIETNCAGSAIGDTKNERWDISFVENMIVAKAIDNGKLVRIYSGAYKDGFLELSVRHSEPNTKKTTQMNVRLQQGEKGKMEGTREIIRPDDCRIVFALEMMKQ